MFAGMAGVQDDIRMVRELIQWADSNAAQVPGFYSGLCFGYIAGIISRSRLAEAINPKSGLLCDLSRLENGQIQEIIVAYLKANPADRHYPSSQLVIQALQTSVCKK